jgi:hypothetical protein
MIVIGSQDSINVVLSADTTTSPLECYASYTDEAPQGSRRIGRNVTRTNGTTKTTLVEPAPAGHSRSIGLISIQNNDTANATVTVSVNVDGSNFKLFTCTIAAGEKMEYENGSGLRVIATSGAIKQSINQGSNPASSGLNRVILANDVVNNNAVANTIADVTGLSFPVISGKLYYFKFTILYDAAATATGSRWAINGPSASYIAGKSKYGLTATTETINYFNAYNIPAAANTTSVATAGNIAVIEGFITPSANGDVIARFASEVGSSAITAKAGSIVEYLQLTA